MFNNHKPYEVKRAKREKGPLNQQRKRVIRATKTANAPHAFANSKFKKRREHRLKRQLESMVIITCGDELDLPLGKADYPIYYVDDTEGANAERPIMDRYWTPGSVLHDFEMMDEPSHREKGFKIYSKNGRLICYKLSDVKRTGITVDDWKEHYEVLKEALDVQPNNPRGNRKIGKYKNYIMFGWRAERLVKKMAKYISKKVKKADEDDPEKVKAHAAKVNRVKVGMKKLIAQFEKIGLIAIPQIDLSIQNKLRKFFNLFRIFEGGAWGRFSQIAVATLYWSPCHVDDDIFYTLLSCYNQTSANLARKDEILFYFLFPSVGKAVPMRSTDILVFNSAFPHCTSNYRFEETITMSMFTSAKTATAQMSTDADLAAESDSDSEVDEEEAKEEE